MRGLPLAVLALVVAAPASAFSEPAATSPAPVSSAGGQLPRAPDAPDPFAIPFEKYTLENGLEVILHRDPSLPLVAVNVWYHVGPSNEPLKRSGFAHLFEHLMFEGSKHVGHEFDLLLESVGATGVNGTTSWDRTNYFETVPRQELELALWLESDRMGFLLPIITQERLDVQRDVVKNERRQTYENSPYGKSELTMYETLFPASHPYHGAVIGSMQDLTSATLADVQDFHRAFYAPSNATLALAGDFDVAQTKEWIARYFAGLPRAPRPPSSGVQTPTLTAEIRKEVREPVQLSRVAMGWLTPRAYSDDDLVLDVVATLLAGGKATRLYQELVVKQKVASEVTASLDSNHLTSMFGVDAMVAAGKDAKSAERALTGAIKRLGDAGPTEAELTRAKRRLRLHVLNDLQRLDGAGGESGRAGTLQRLNHYLGDPGRLGAYVARISSVSAADVKRAVTAYLKPTARVVVTTLPEETAAPAPAPKGNKP
jgi:zinc protease